MNLAIIKDRVAKIAAAQNDCEKAHSLEDDLFLDFLNYLAKSPRNAFNVQKMAQEILKTQDLDFDRWCA